MQNVKNEHLQHFKSTKNSRLWSLRTYTITMRINIHKTNKGNYKHAEK
jgi:hypothetical protein